MNKSEREALIENKTLKIKILKRARAIVKKPSYNSGICAALWQVRNETFKNYDIVKYLTDYISRNLKGGLYLEGWLIRKLPATANVFGNPKKVKATRIAWIDWMTACLQEDIDKLEKK